MHGCEADQLCEEAQVDVGTAALPPHLREHEPRQSAAHPSLGFQLSGIRVGRLDPSTASRLG